MYRCFIIMGVLACHVNYTVQLKGGKIKCKFGWGGQLPLCLSGSYAHGLHAWLQLPKLTLFHTVWYPGFPIEPAMYWILMLELGFYLHSIFATVYLETRRKDFAVMLSHHFATAGLLFFAFITRYLTNALTNIFRCYIPLTGHTSLGYWCSVSQTLEMSSLSLESVFSTSAIAMEDDIIGQSKWQKFCLECLLLNCKNKITKKQCLICLKLCTVLCSGSTGCLQRSSILLYMLNPLCMALLLWYHITCLKY